MTTKRISRATLWILLLVAIVIALLPSGAPSPAEIDRRDRLARADAGIPAGAKDAEPIERYEPAAARSTAWRYWTASAFGPGLWGNRTYCGQILRRDTVGIARPRPTCGRVFRICKGGRCVDAPVIDKGPFVDGREVDLTEEVVQRLGYRSTSAWGVREVRARCVRRCG